MASEAAIQQEVRLAAPAAGLTLFRNNSGAYKDPHGRLIRYGVASPGGSDLIGWRTIEITPDMVGRKVAVFAAVEVKTPTGRATPAQLHFLEVVRRAGGIAIIARSADDLAR